MYSLRPYQQRALDELMSWLNRHNDGNPIVDACVGAGKSIIIAELCKSIIELDPQARIVMCVASKELCQQNLEKLRAIWEDAPAGVCSASLGQKDMNSQIIFATIGSIAKYAHELGKVNILIIDECHNVNSDNAGMYRSFIEDIKKYGSPYVCVIGFTGTPFRGDGIWLWQGKDPLFAGTATRVTMDELLKLGFLSPLVVDQGTPETIDTTGVKTSMGDYVVKDLENAALDPVIIKKTVSDLCERGAERKKWLIFCVTIDHAKAVLDELKVTENEHFTLNLNPEMVTSKTSNIMRSDILARFKLPHNQPSAINCLVNVACLTTGFDAPSTDLIALLRPTKSPVLYVQIAGRGMRIADGKQNCLWLDYTSTTRDLGPVNLIKGRNKINVVTDGTAPFKYCPDCGNMNPIHATECVECGALIPVNQNSPHNSTASNALPLHGFQSQPQLWFDIEQVGYYKHQGKNGKPPTLRIDYHVVDEVYPISEWKCFEHDGFALRMASQWWSDHMVGFDIPFSVDEALQLIHENQLTIYPTRIQCQKDAQGKFWQIKKYEYERKDRPTVISFGSNPDFLSNPVTGDIAFNNRMKNDMPTASEIDIDVPF